MKVKGEKNCQAKVRNTGNIERIKIEYDEPEVIISFWDHEKKSFEKCVEFEYKLDYDGVWVITGGNSAKFAD